MVHVVVIYPLFVSGVVRWVYIDALDAPFILWQEGFEGFEVVAVNNFVANLSPCPLSTREREAGLRRLKGVFVFKYPKGDVLMMILYFFFSYPMKCGHN
jgi:hypothetical protein